MQQLEKRNITEYPLCPASQLSPIKTFECGQCFRWNAQDDIYFGIHQGKGARILVRDDMVYIEAEEEDRQIWRDYFDLDRDYEKIVFPPAGDYFDRCYEFGQGIRILRQNRWEALCSFIISQCNNIPRIKGIVERLCSEFGDPIIYGDSSYYSFPSPERIALLEPEDLAPIRSGYRAAFIINAARAVCEGFDLDSIALMSHNEAVKELCTLKGVGKKVANCAALFGLNIMSGFPIDTWIKKALKENFPEDFDPMSFGDFAGLAQQYIFYYARSGGV